MLGGASCLLCGCHILVGGRVCSPVVGVETTRSSSKLPCVVSGTGALPLGKDPLHIPLQELSMGMCDSVTLPATWCVCPQTQMCLHCKSIDNHLMHSALPAFRVCTLTNTSPQNPWKPCPVMSTLAMRFLWWAHPCPTP